MESDATAEREKPPQVHGVYITLERQMKYSGSVFRAGESAFAGICRARFQEIVDNEADSSREHK